MRVAIVYDALYPYVAGGAERRYFEIGRRLSARGHDVRYVSWQYWDGPRVRADEWATLHGAGLARPLHDEHGRRTFREALSFGLRIAPVLSGVRADVIECSSIPYVSTFAAAGVARSRRTPLVVSWHEFMGDRWNAYAGRSGSLAAMVERLSARQGDARVAVSEFTRRRLPKGPPTSVVPNGVDCRAIANVAPAVNAPDVVVAARLVPHKRVDLLVRALAHAPEVTAGIIGDGPEGRALEQLAASIGVGDRVRFYGHVAQVDDVYALLKGAKAVVSTSEQEGFGMTVVEAQACGTPPIVVASPHSAAPELVTHEHDGLVCDASPEAIAGAIMRVARDADFRAHLAGNAATAAARFDWDRITEQTDALYRRLLRGGTREIGQAEERVAA